MALAMAGNLCVQAQHRDEFPGGWNFETPLMSISSSTYRTKIHFIPSSELSFGFIGGIRQQQGVSIDMGESYEIEWGNVLRSKVRLSNRDFMSIGIGFDWRNYRMTKPQMFAKGAQGQISVVDYPAGTEPQFSRIHTFSLSFPLKYYHFLNRRIYFGIGPELYLTPHASLKTRYITPEGKNARVRLGNLHHNRFSVGVGAELIVRHVGIYYKYNPFPVLSQDYGPGFSSMTAGLRVAL